MSNKARTFEEIDDIIEGHWARRIEGDIPLDDYNEVLPGVILGDKMISTDKVALKQMKITHVLNAAMGKGLDQIDTNTAYFEDCGIQFHGIDAFDKPDCKLSPYFNEAADYIDSALEEGGRVFVHCMLGMSRSTSLVLAYLMLKKSMELIPAIKLLQENRPMDINKGFLSELYDLEQKLRSSR